MIIGFTGTQMGMSQSQKERLESLLKVFRPTFVVHGGCIGADSEFHLICRKLVDPRPAITVYPSNIQSKHGVWPGADFVAHEDTPLSRNRTIVNVATLLIATPAQNEEILRSGTWATIRYAKKHNVPVIILYRWEMKT